MCVHGRKNYIQATGLVQFFFYKNISYNLPFVWYSFFNGFSAQVRSAQRPMVRPSSSADRQSVGGGGTKDDIRFVGDRLLQRVLHVAAAPVLRRVRA